MATNLKSLENAYKTFVLFSNNIENLQDLAGAIQAFEFTLELSWKTIRRFFADQGIKIPIMPKDVIRLAAQVGLISDPKMWFLFIDMRNLTSHTYNQSVAEQIKSCFFDFEQAVGQLIAALEKLKNES